MSGKISGADHNSVQHYCPHDEPANKPKQPEPEAAPPPALENYEIKPGDTLSKLAARRGISLDAILRDNPNIKNPDKIYAGQHLNLAGGANAGDYTIRRGDNLTQIARRHNTSVGDILRANPGKINNPNLIYPGQTLRIPNRTNTPPANPNAPTNTPGTNGANGATPIAPTPGTNGTQAAQINLDEFLSPARGSNAGFAVLIGNAEGNRTADGGFTQHYHGHRDPGDGLWNIGSFSRANARFGNARPARSPEEADRMHLQHMQRAQAPYVEAMRRHGLDPNNALLASTYFDAFNQSERAASKMLAPENLRYLQQHGVSIETMKEWRVGGYVNLQSGERWRNANGTPVGGGLANVARQRLGRQPSEAEIIQTIRQDQGRRINELIEPLRRMNLLTIGGTNTAPQQPGGATPTNGIGQTQGAQGTRLTGASNTSIDVLLPAQGRGYTVYNRTGDDQYGRANTINAIRDIADAWANNNNVRIQIGDISRHGGGRFAPHSTHREGTDIDIRPIRSDGRMLPTNINDPSYSRSETRELIQLIKARHPNATILFNDPVLIREGLTTYSGGHHNHLHVVIR